MASQFSSDSSVTRQLVGVRMDVAVSFHNPTDIAFTLSNLQLTAQTTDPQNPAALIPVATLVPDGTASTINIGPGETRGPILFSNAQVFPNLIEDLMRSPRGLVYNVANFDLVTGDGRNFAFGLESVRAIHLIHRQPRIRDGFEDGFERQRVLTGVGDPTPARVAGLTDADDTSWAAHGHGHELNFQGVRCSVSGVGFLPTPGTRHPTCLSHPTPQPRDRRCRNSRRGLPDHGSCSRGRRSPRP
jgi:hypothetical protein